MAPKKTTKPKKESVTKEVLDANPGLKKAGVKVGDEVEYANKPVRDTDVKMVIFTLQGGSHREFSQEVHGKDFRKVADEFEATNASIITGRADA